MSTYLCKHGTPLEFECVACSNPDLCRPVPPCAECERLKAERDRLTAELHEASADLRTMIAEATQLKAERDSYRDGPYGANAMAERAAKAEAALMEERESRLAEKAAALADNAAWRERRAAGGAA